jgi:hypothetical protein
MSTDPEALDALLARWDATDRPEGWNAGDEHHLAAMLIDELRAGYSKPREADTDEVDRVAAAIAQAAGGDYWVDEIAQWQGTEQWERDAHPENYPGSAYEDREWYRKQARAAIAAGYSKQHPPTVTDKMVEAAWVAGSAKFGAAETPGGRDRRAMRAALEAALGAVRPAPEPPTVEEWIERVAAERARHPEKGYDAAHDRKHGADHLLNWAIDYSRRGEAEKSSSLIAAARDVLRATRPAPEAEWEYGIRGPQIPSGVRGSLEEARSTQKFLQSEPGALVAEVVRRPEASDERAGRVDGA